MIAAALTLSSCGITTDKKDPITQHHIHGVIQTLDASVKTATIKHGDIPGFMGAMTMEYPVRDNREFGKLHIGETIDGTVFVQDTDFWVGNIQEGK